MNILAEISGGSLPRHDLGSHHGIWQRSRDPWHIGDQDEKHEQNCQEGQCSHYDGHELWSFPETTVLPTNALVVSREVPQIDMVARGFLDVASARKAAFERAYLATALLTALGLGIVLIALWRRRVADQLAFEAAANATLEARVEQRTNELRATQDQLVQASKMTALGQMYAGLSHELNQTLAAIRAFAENAAQFRQLGRSEEVDGNLGQISKQVDRMTRIINGLRGFARA